MMQRLWREEAGAIITAEIMLIASILVLGCIVGLKSVRDAVVTELADVAQALSNVDQSFWFSGTAGHHAYTAGGIFFDFADFCDNFFCSPIQESKCVTICNSFTHPNGYIGDGF